MVQIQLCSATLKGKTHIDSKSTHPSGTWQEATVGINVILPRNMNAKDQWSLCSYVIAESGDKCKLSGPLAP